MMILSKLADLRSLADALTFRRVSNLGLLALGYFSYLVTRRTYNPGLPFAITLEPTTSCNLNCLACPTGTHSLTRPKGFINMDLYRNSIDQMGKHLLHLTLFFQGEPYIHPDFHAMVAYAHSKKIYVATSTNGHFLEDADAVDTIVSGLNKLIISLDGTDEQTYSSYRKGGDFNRVTSGITRLAEWKRKLGVKHPYIIIQFLVHSTNKHQAEHIERLGLELGADEVRLKTTPARCPNSSDTIDPSPPVKNRCLRMWTSPVITWDGDVTPCRYDTDADHLMGNVGTRSFRDIWKSPEYKKFRTQVRNSRKSIELCCNCMQQW